MDAELRWVIVKTNHIGAPPTAPDALEYANDKLSDPEEFSSSVSDKRILLNVFQLMEKRNNKQ